MTVQRLLDNINDLLKDGKLTPLSNVTVHAYVRDGVAVEWKDDINIECWGPEGDGLQLNVDTENSGIFYIDPYDTHEDKNQVVKQLLDFKDKDGNPYFNEKFIKEKFV